MDPAHWAANVQPMGRCYNEFTLTVGSSCQLKCQLLQLAAHVHHMGCPYAAHFSFSYWWHSCSSSDIKFKDGKISINGIAIWNGFLKSFTVCIYCYNSKIYTRVILKLWELLKISWTMTRSVLKLNLHVYGIVLFTHSIQKLTGNKCNWYNLVR